MNLFITVYLTCRCLNAKCQKGTEKHSIGVKNIVSFLKVN